MSAPSVSVLMLVYEHEAFVAQAIDSVLAQQCDFAYELIVINDGSNDGSAAVCRAYAEANPSIVRFIDAPENRGMHESFAALWQASRAELVAFCEGDDYWVDTHKLQKQVDLMKQHSHWSLCGADANTIELSPDHKWLETGVLGPHIKQSEYSFEDLIGSYHFHFSTVMLRKRAVEFPPWFKRVYCVDRPLYLLAAQHGQAGYINSVVSCYRIHSGGNWSSISSLRKAEQSIDLFGRMANHFAPRYKQHFETTLFFALQTYVAREMSEKRYAAARKIFCAAFKHQPFLNQLWFLKQYYRTAILLLIRR